MTNTMIGPTAQRRLSQTVGQQPGQTQQQPGQPGQPGSPPGGGLPPTGLQQQLTSLNSLYGNITRQTGYDPRAQQFGQAQAAGGGELDPDTPMGSTSLDQMARNLAQRYGMPIGRGRLVDEYGNFLMTPQQIADASGGSVTLGEAAAQMNYISSALTRRQNEEQQQKGIGALQTGLGQIQSRGRGSLAALTSGYYQDIANMYANKEYEAADFSYYIQKEQQDIARDLQARAEKMAKKQARGQFFGGLGIGITSLLMGNVGGAVGGLSMAAGSAGQTGWF